MTVVHRLFNMMSFTFPSEVLGPPTTNHQPLRSCDQLVFRAANSGVIAASSSPAVIVPGW